MNKFSFRKYGNGSSVYEVFIMTKYNDIAKVAYYDVLGFVEKVNGEWVTESYGGLKAKSRKMLVEKMEKSFRDKMKVK